MTVPPEAVQNGRSRANTATPGIREPTRAIVPWWFGFLLWAPGVGVPVSHGHYLELVDVLDVCWAAGAVLLVMSGTYPRPGRRAVLLLGAMIGSWVLSVVTSLHPGDSVPYFAYYVGLTLPAMLLMYSIARDFARLIRFIEGFFIGGVVTALAGICQFVTGGFPDIVNNAEFTLLTASGRANGFAPEPSIMAGLTLLALAMLVGIRSTPSAKNYRGWIFRRGNQNVLFLVLMTGLLVTRSTQVVGLLPLAVGFGLTAASGPKRAARVFLLVMIPLGILIGGFYELFWKERLKSDANASAFTRLATTIAAADEVTHHWGVGVGLGQGNEVALKRLKQLGGSGPLSALFARKTGVNNFVIRCTLEQGIPFAACFIVAAWWLFGPSFGAASARDRLVVAILGAYGMTAVAMAASSTGYRGLLHVWAIFPFAAAMPTRGSLRLSETRPTDS